MGCDASRLCSSTQARREGSAAASGSGQAHSSRGHHPAAVDRCTCAERSATIDATKLTAARSVLQAHRCSIFLCGVSWTRVVILVGWELQAAQSTQRCLAVHPTLYISASPC
eukprot:3538974-Pleurochrysis_carterae.AAC.1